MTLTLDALTAEDCEQVRLWRNAHRPGLRTTVLLTREMQADFYAHTVCDRHSPHRYWAIRQDCEDPSPCFHLIGMGGLTDIAWENGTAEISLITDPARRGQGLGTATVGLLLREAFDQMRLWTVSGECYHNNPALRFWRRCVVQYGGQRVLLHGRKWADGQLWDADYFWFVAPTVVYRLRQETPACDSAA